MLEWLLQNKEWLFSGIGIFIMALAINIFSSQIPPATSKLGSLIARIPFSDWFKKNEEWIFSGFRVFIAGIIISITANITADKVKQDTMLESYSTQLESLENVEQSLAHLFHFYEPMLKMSIILELLKI